MYLLDTNVVSELRRPNPHGAVVAWLTSVPESAVHLCAFTLGELQAGVEKTRRQDPARAAEIESWVDLVASTQDVFDLDAETFRIWAKLIEAKPDAVRDDALIAACARRHSLTLVTGNVRHFKAFGVPLLDPFTWKG
ncbi:MAG: type II toxin-antitoxin system VapC family toxin [Actinomycetia bacterium]|nr:type II toxin-antitoxin system VapC family toxin [Actinomycetes bacterium]